MTADVQRELAATIREQVPAPRSFSSLDLAAALLPTVQRLIADAEKRAAARAAAYAWEQGYDSCRQGEQRRNPYRAAAIAALDPSGAAEGAGR